MKKKIAAPIDVEIFRRIQAGNARSDFWCVCVYLFYLQSNNLGRIYGAGHREEKEDGVGALHIGRRPFSGCQILVPDHDGAREGRNYVARQKDRI